MQAVSPSQIDFRSAPQFTPVTSPSTAAIAPSHWKISGPVPTQPRTPLPRPTAEATSTIALFRLAWLPTRAAQLAYCSTGSGGGGTDGWLQPAVPGVQLPAGLASMIGLRTSSQVGSPRISARPGGVAPQGRKVAGPPLRSL